MEITEVRIVPSDDEGVAAYASITFDDCFAVHGLKLKVSKKGDYYLFMPGRKLADGTYVDHPAGILTEDRSGEGFKNEGAKNRAVALLNPCCDHTALTVALP